MRDRRVAELRPGDPPLWIAGRLLARASNGPDLVLRDGSGEVAVAGELAELRGGDIVALRGALRDGRFAVESARLLLRPQVDPFTDPEWRRLADPRHQDNLRLRDDLMRAVRRFFGERGFLEVDTGQMVDEPGQEPTLEPFRAGRGRFLITSPELRMKRLLAAGHERIFELSHCFRSGPGERSVLHHPEFAMLEWYRAFADEHALMADLEALLPACAAVRDKTSLPLATPFERISVREAFARHAGVDLEPFLDGDAEGFRAAARRAGVSPVTPDTDPETLFFRVFLDRVERRLGWDRPALLTEYPASMAALARLDAADPRVARRFELYVRGVELANGFCELNDADEQRRRFERERARKRAEGRDPGPFPERFLRALETGMPPAAGIALGMERLLLLLAGAERIDDVLPFPDDPLREPV